MNDQPKSDPTPSLPPTQPLETPAKAGLASLICLGGLLLALGCAFFFDAFTIKLFMNGEPLDETMIGDIMPSVGSYPAIKSVIGRLAALAALAGIALWIWNHQAGEKHRWVLRALFGAAALSSVLSLVFMLASIQGATKLEMAESRVTMTPLGFWLPLAGAVTATLAALRRLKSAA